MIKSGLDSEKEWIDNNPQFYRNSEHANLVKQNIELRYRAKAMINKIDVILRNKDKQK